MNLTRPRKARILEKAGLRYVAGWLPVNTAVSVQSDIQATEFVVKQELEKEIGGKLQ